LSVWHTATTVWDAVFQAGFFSNPAVHSAAIVGAMVALVCGPVGVFTVLRGQSFAGHAFSDITSTGGSAAVVIGINPLAGFAAVGAIGALAMETLGAQRYRGRDLVTGVVLGAALGLSALFLYLSVTGNSTTGAVVTVLFGSIFAVSGGTLPLVAVVGGFALVLIATVYRPLLLSSVSPELAAAEGVRVRTTGLTFLVALSLAVALSALTIGAILSTALLIGPAATALRFARSPARAVGWAVAIAAGALAAGIVMAYDSYDWPPSQQGWPVSFFVVVLVLCAYVLPLTVAQYRRRLARRRARRRAANMAQVTTDSRDEHASAGGSASPIAAG